MINTFEDFVQNKVDFIPNYEKIKDKINTEKYIKKNKQDETIKKHYWRIVAISLSVLLIILMIPIFIMLNHLPFGSELPQPIPEIEKIENTRFNGYLNITLGDIFQDDKDTIILNVETALWSTKKLKALCIKGNSLEIINAEAFAKSLEIININGEKYYYIDLVVLQLDKYKNFSLFLDFEKNSCSENVIYSDIVKYNIIAHSFDIYINYGYEETEKQNLRFYYDTDDIYGDKILCYNNINDILKYSDFQELYLPDVDKYNISKELTYSPTQKHLAINSSNFYQYSADVTEVSFSLGIWVSDTGITYGDQTKISYSYKEIDYIIIIHEAYVTYEYSIDFTVIDSKTNKILQYSYLIKTDSIDKVKEFIHSINLYTIADD